MKLNFSRFMKMEQLTLGLDVDTGNSKAATKQYANDVQQNVIATNEKAISSMDKIQSKTETAWSGKALTGARDVIRNYKNQFKEMQNLAKSPFATAKFKLEAQSFLNKDRLSGFSGLKLKDAASVPQSSLNKMITAGESIGKKNVSESIRQDKELAKVEKELANAIDKTSESVTKQAVTFQDKKVIFSDFTSNMGTLINKENEIKKSISNTFATLRHAAVSWRILYGAFSQIWNVLSGTVEKAAAYQEALNLYTVALGEYAEQGSKWAEKISNALFLDPKQIMQYTGAFYNLTKGLGVTSDAAYKMSTNLTQLSYDMSSYLNIDVEAAHDKIQSAMTGQSRAVASAGIAMQQASLQELAYQLGIQKTVSEMTQAEKTYLRYIQIMRSTSNMQGDLARTIVTPENAIRVIKQQFELLGRAIGQVFIPIVMTAIPYVMALTRALTALANKLASMLGFKIASIDYSSLKTADTAVEDTFNNIANSAGSGAKSVGDSINRTLAAFDELNVVESESKGAGGTGGVGGIGDPTTLAALEDYIDGYDMLQGLTDELSKKTDAAYENLKKLWGVAQLLGGIFVGWKALKLANTVAGWAQAFTKAFNAGTGIPGIFTRLIDGFRYAQFQGDNFFTSVVAGFRNILGPLGKFVASVALIGTSFFSGLTIFKGWNMEADDFNNRLLKTTGIVGGLTAAAFLLVGPWAAVGTAIAGIAGAIIGAKIAEKEYYDELEKEAAYYKLFDGVGISIETITKSFTDSTTELLTYYKELGTAADELDKTKTELSNTQTAFFDLHNAFQAGVDDEATFNRLTASVEDFKNGINKARDASINYNKTALDNMLKEGQINKEEYDKMLQNVQNYYTHQALYQSEYADELVKLDTQLKEGRITQEEYNNKVGELEKKYAGVITSLELQGSNLEKLYAVYGRKINFRNEEEVKKLYEDLTEVYNKGKDEIEKQREKSNEYFDEQIAHNQLLIMDLEKRRDSWNDIDRQMYDDAKAALETFTEEQRLTNEGYAKDLETLSAQYGNYLATMNAQLVESGADTVNEMQDVVDSIRDQLVGITEDADIKNAPNDLFGNWMTQFQANGKELGMKTKNIFGEVGITATDELFYNMMYGTEKGFTKLQEDIEKDGEAVENQYGIMARNSASNYSQELISEIEKNSPTIQTKTKKQAVDIGWNLHRGLMEGFDNDKVSSEFDTNMDNIVSTVKKRLGIESPSKVFYSIGQNMMLGLSNAIGNETPIIKDKVNTLMNDIVSRVQGTKVDFNFNTDVTSSFNKILDKLQSFANKWRTGINNILSKTASSFGSIVLNAMNKLTYSAMSWISIPTFAQGGYPTSGDLFMANENGRAEYITSLGNRTAVANQDQMVQALTNAITESIGAVSNNQPGLTQIYIGNEKIYEGYGTYQNRQADRYGTTTIKI